MKILNHLRSRKDQTPVSPLLVPVAEGTGTGRVLNKEPESIAGTRKSNSASARLKSLGEKLKRPFNREKTTDIQKTKGLDDQDVIKKVTGHMVLILISVAVALVIIALVCGILLYMSSAREEQTGIALRLLYKEVILSQDVASEASQALVDFAVVETGRLVTLLTQLSQSVSLDGSGDGERGLIEILETLDAELHSSVKSSAGRAQALAKDVQSALQGSANNEVLEGLLSGTLRYAEELQGAAETLHNRTQWMLLQALPLIFMFLLLLLAPAFLLPLWSQTHFIRQRFHKIVNNLQMRDKAVQKKMDNTVELLVPIIYDRLMPQLHVISGVLAIMATSNAPRPTRKLLSIAERCAAFLLRSVHSSAEYILAEADLLQTSAVRFDLRACVEDCIRVLHHRALAKGLRLACHIRPECPTTIVSDEKRLRQVLLKLLALGLEHTSAGKVEVLVSVVSVSESRIKSDAGRDADQMQEYTLKFEVIDSGRGMSSALKRNLLEPTKLKDRHGIGLRILVAKKLAKLLGGHLQLFSNLQKGTSWSLTTRCAGAWTLKDLHPQLAQLDHRVSDVLATKGKFFVVISLGLSLGSKRTLTGACQMCGVSSIHAASFREVVKILSSRHILGCVVMFGERILHLQTPEAMIAQIHDRCNNFHIGWVQNRDSKESLSEQILKNSKEGSGIQNRSQWQNVSSGTYTEPLCTADVMELLGPVLVEKAGHAAKSRWDNGGLGFAKSASVESLKSVSKEDQEIVKDATFGKVRSNSSQKGSPQKNADKKEGVGEFEKTMSKEPSEALQRKRSLRLRHSNTVHVLDESNTEEYTLLPPLLPDLLQTFPALPDVPKHLIPDAGLILRTINRFGPSWVDAACSDLCQDALDDSDKFLYLGEEGWSSSTLQAAEEYYTSQDTGTYSLLQGNGAASSSGEPLGLKGRTSRFQPFDKSALLVDKMDSGSCIAPILFSHKDLRELESKAASFAMNAAPLREISGEVLGDEKGGKENDMQRLFSWDLDELSLSSTRVAQMSYQLIDAAAKQAKLKVGSSTIWNFVLTLQANYHSVNPYHNFWHGFGVARALGRWARSREFQDVLEPHAALGLEVAAFAVDVDHPGVSNRYLCSRRSLIGLVYSERSVLENHHAALLCLILRDSPCSLFAELSDADFHVQRKRMVNAILATDKAKFFDILSKLQEASTNLSRGGGAGSPSAIKEQLAKLDRSFVEMALMHAADVAFPLLPFDLCFKWARRITIEFHNQNLLEQEHDLPLSMPQITGTDDFNVAEAQVGLISQLCQPLFSSLGLFFQDSIIPRCHVMRENKSRFEALRQELEDELRKQEETAGFEESANTQTESPT